MGINHGSIVRYKGSKQLYYVTKVDFYICKAFLYDKGKFFTIANLSELTKVEIKKYPNTELYRKLYPDGKIVGEFYEVVN